MIVQVLLIVFVAVVGTVYVHMQARYLDGKPWTWKEWDELRHR